MVREEAVAHKMNDSSCFIKFTNNTVLYSIITSVEYNKQINTLPECTLSSATTSIPSAQSRAVLPAYTR